MGEGGGGGVEGQRLVVVYRSDCGAAEFSAVEVFCVQALAAVHTVDVVSGDGRLDKVAGSLVDDVG